MEFNPLPDKCKGKSRPRVITSQIPRTGIAPPSRHRRRPVEKLRRSANLPGPPMTPGLMLQQQAR